ncbi:MAG: hypothetical protein F4X08_03490 [Gemmatimonadetes bacterium]|nr:hypothetical protein [Gemmatimonadota bacterium]MYD24862.1 hypothetical protein [Gemmatimonadota bacterium]MYI98566.1 hypothetical protein [Gemmatimonadota bacterium]
MKRSELDLLYRSLDASLTPGEQSRLDAALRRDPGLRDEYERLVRLRSQVENQESPSFRADFSQRVMERLAAESTAIPASNPEGGTTPEFEDALSLMFRKVAVAASVAAVLLLTYNLATSENVSITTSFGLTEELYPEDLYDARIALESEGEL